MLNRSYALEEVNSFKKAEECNPIEEKNVFGSISIVHDMK